MIESREGRLNGSYLLFGRPSRDSLSLKLGLVWFLLVVFVLLVHATTAAPLCMTGFALFLHLFKLRALLLRQDAEHLLMPRSHGLTQLGAQCLHASLSIGGRLSLCAVVKAAHLFALSLGARFKSVFDGAELLPLSVRQVELAHQPEHPAGTPFAHTVTPASAAPRPLLLPVVLRNIRGLLREGNKACGEDETERQASPG